MTPYVPLSASHHNDDNRQSPYVTPGLPPYATYFFPSSPSIPTGCNKPSSSFVLPNFPNSQSVSPTTPPTFPKLPLSSTCSIVCCTILPSSSNSKMKMPLNSPSLLSGPRISASLSNCFGLVAPAVALSVNAPASWSFPQVRQRTISFSDLCPPTR